MGLFQNSLVLTKLPDDCMLLIYQKLDNIDDRNAFGLTCHRWLQIQSLARRSLVLQLSNDPNIYKYYSKHLRGLLTRFPHVSSIFLAGLAELPDSAIARLRDSGANLCSLSFCYCLGITDDGLAQVSVGCSNLVTLSLYRCNITNAGLVSLAQSCHNLQNLNLSYCTRISDYGINALMQGCPKIRVLMISYCKGITGVGFRGCPSTFAYLEADSCVLTEEGIHAAVSGGGLEYFNLSSLRVLVGKDITAEIGSGFAERLLFLNMRTCRFVTDDSVIAISKGCPLLENWNLDLCHRVQFPGWEAIGSNCKRLRILHVNRCRNLCDQGLQALRNCQRLDVLYMHGCPNISPFGLELFKTFRQDVEVRPAECMSIGPRIDDFFKV